MAGRDADIIIHGGGIAGLWILNRLKSAGYNVLLVEPNAIGGVQTIASQGIIHSGLKYALTGKISPLARHISEMPNVWRDCLQGNGAVDLSKAKVAAESQYLLVPSGIMGEAVKLAAKQLIGQEIAKPKEIIATGFKGCVIHMGEPVLDVPSVVRVLAEPHLSSIRKSADGIEAKLNIHTAAEGNEGQAIQKRPLLMGLLRGAPFPLWAHLTGASEKPVATITTHTAKDGKLIWYIGGQVAERKKESDPREGYDSIYKAIEKYLPDVEIEKMEWATFGIDRVEAKTKGIMPDGPVVRRKENHIYAWPTKLTFAPLMADMIYDEINFGPSGKETDWSFLPEVGYAEPPWETVHWKKEN